jgi:serine/threonine protein kinase/ankyrin repeat protein
MLTCFVNLQQQQNGAPAPVYIRGSSVVNGPQSLAVQSSSRTPEEKRNLSKKKKQSRLSLHSMKERTEHSQNVARPETKNDFMSLDFVQRCAIAGLQLGKTKVFLRREAFDRIEAMRSQKFFGSAVLIQAMVRGKICREHYKKMRVASIIIQTLVRKMLSKIRLEIMRQDVAKRGTAALVIQRAFRRVKFKQENNELRIIFSHAASLIQARVRGMNARTKFYHALFGFIRLQALSRGVSARTSFLKFRQQKEAEKVMQASKVPEPKSPVAVVKKKEKKKEPAPLLVHEEPVEAVTASLPAEEIIARTADLYRYMQEEDWANVEKALDQNPILATEVEPSSGELPLHVIARHTSAWTLLVDMALVLNPKALIHRDQMGALPIHHAAAHDNLSALEIIYTAYNGGINDVDMKGRLPLHVAAEFDAVDAVKFLLANSPEGAFTMVYRPVDGSGGGLPLHVACRNYASIGVITALLAENFASAKRADENGDLPLHLLLRCGEVVDQVVVKTLLTCFSSAASRTDMNGDLPLSIALKNRCKPTVVNSILMQYPNAASTLNSEGQSPLHLAFEFGADDRTLLGLLNHAPEFATLVDKKSGLLPIQVATQNEHSHFIVHNMLKRDLPIDFEEKIRAQLLPHHYSWNHIVTDTDDLYHQVVTKVLQQCTQPQVLALAHVEGPDGKIALASATTVCKHEMRVMLRLFNTLEVVNQRPAYTNPISDTQIFYALRYEPPSMQSSAFTILHEEKIDKALGDYVEDWDDTSVASAVSRASARSTLSTRSQQSIDDKLRQIRKEKGQQVIAKLTSRSDIVERELKVRKDFRLSRHYVPAVISVHHTVQHAAYSEAMAEPGYCITMEGADTTAENLMLDMRKAGKPFPTKALKRIGISLLHMHEHQLVHCDFGTHNIGKFGSRWKLLGVGGSVPIGKASNPNRGFYHPPESIVVENKRAAIGKKSITAVVVSIPSRPTYDIWAYGVVFYEAVAGLPLSPYACRGKRPMTSGEVAKIGLWDENSVKKALKHLPDGLDSNAKSLIKRLLHHDPTKRYNSMRQVLEHPFFANSSSSVTTSSSTLVSNKEMGVPQAVSTQSMSSSSPDDQSSSRRRSKHRQSLSSRPGKAFNADLAYVDENTENAPREGPREVNEITSMASSTSKRSKKFSTFRNRFKK